MTDRANDNRQTVRGRVISGDDIAVVRTDPIRIGADGKAEAEIVFDRPVAISLETLMPDPQDRDDLFDALHGILNSDSSRFDDLFAQGGMDPSRDLVGSDFSEAEFIGSPERPLDMRGWNLGRCNLKGCRFEHVIIDETTILEDTDLDDITGPDAQALLDLVTAAPRPR